MVDVPPKTKKRLFLIDGYALIYRAFFAMISRPLTTSRGENTSAAFGMTRFLLKIREDYEPDYLGVAMDAGTSQRTEIFPEYKATREKMPDELSASLPRIRALLDAFRVPILELPDHEADDVIGTLATRAVEAGLEAVIVSGDKDFYQLIRPGICLLNPGRGGAGAVEEEWVDLSNAAERLGVPPHHVVDYLALIGDSSDNVPGAKGIGPKTAIKLIESYGGVERILEHVEEITGKRAREALLEHRADVSLSKDLVTIRTDLPVELDVDALAICEPDREKLRELFVELEFHTLARELGTPADAGAVEREGEYHVARSADDVVRLVERARKAGRFALDVEATEEGPLRGDLVGVALCLEAGEAHYLPFGHRRPGELALDASPGSLPPLGSEPMRALADLLADPSVTKVGHDVKRSLLALRRAGVALRGIAFDTMVASYLIDPGRRDHELDSLALQYLGHHALTYEELCGKGRDRRPIAECSVDQVKDYACQRADVAYRLMVLFEEELERYQQMRLFREVEVPLIEVLAELEWAGIRIDPGFFGALARKLSEELEHITSDIYKEAGMEFNINSTPQLREVLFDKLELPVLKKTKTGASTDVTVLEQLAAEGYALPRLLMEYRQLDKLKNTYVDALPQLVNKETGRIHTSFNQTVAATGRLSSSDPNLQNIPIRTDVGAELRKGFIPAEGCLFLAADYSQIELRILAHLSGDPGFVDAFRGGRDIHRETAARIFDVSADEVTGEMRGAAKTINFATIYGIGPYALGQRLGIGFQEAKEFIANYFERFPKVRAYLDEQIRKAKEKGYVETVSGRRRYIPELRSKNYNIRQFGERAATNAPVQGSAADIIKIAMIRIQDVLRERGGETRMLLQVHDELVFEAPREEVEEVRNLVTARMEGAFELEVPLEVATGIGENWFECK